MHKPFSVTKALDRSSPFLHFVLTQSENLSRIVLRFYRPSPTGAEELAYIVQLHHATICSVHLKVLNTKNPRYTTLPALEEVAFAYQRIEWIWTDGMISAEDDWEVARIA